MATYRTGRRSKVTKNGRLMGRPPGSAPAGIIRFEQPQAKRRLAAKAPPKPVKDVATGEHAEAFGPPRPIYEYREGYTGRWGQTVSDETLWIVRAIAGQNRPGYAAARAEELGLTEAAVKRKLTRTRAKIRAADENPSAIPRAPRRVSDIPSKK